MLYPVYIQIGDDKHAHGVVYPDFEGCFSAADTWEGLPAAIQEAAESETNFLLQGNNGIRLLRAVDDINNGRNLQVHTLTS